MLYPLVIDFVKQPLQLAKILGALQRNGSGNQPLLVPLGQRMIQCAHSFLGLGLQHAWNLVGEIFADEMAYSGCADHDFKSRYPATSTRLGQKGLGNHASKNRGELGAYILLMV